MLTFNQLLFSSLILIFFHDFTNIFIDKILKSSHLSKWALFWSTTPKEINSSLNWESRVLNFWSEFVDRTHFFLNYLKILTKRFLYVANKLSDLLKKYEVSNSSIFSIVKSIINSNGILFFWPHFYILSSFYSSNLLSED